MGSRPHPTAHAAYKTLTKVMAQKDALGRHLTLQADLLRDFLHSCNRIDNQF